jgi:hypothetical protein
MKKNIFLTLALLTCTPSLFAETPDLQDPFGPVYDPMDEEHATAHAFNQMRQKDDSQKLEQDAPEQTATRAPVPKKKVEEKPTGWRKRQEQDARKKEIGKELANLKTTQNAASNSINYYNDLISDSEQEQSSYGNWSLGQLVAAGLIASSPIDNRVKLIGSSILSIASIKNALYLLTTPEDIISTKDSRDLLNKQMADRATRITELEEELSNL